MTPVIDNRGAFSDKACMHALFVGISEYGPYLPPVLTPNAGDGPPNFGMQTLTAAAASAVAMYDWLTDNAGNLRLPLGTCRLLLAPSATEVNRLRSVTDIAWTQATRETFREAVVQWRKDVATHSDNIALFYFAGHGIQLKYGDQVLLFPGFGRPDEDYPLLSEGVRLNEIMEGMAPSTDRPQIGLTQLYFIDACRNKIPYFASQEKVDVPQLWQYAKIGKDERTVSSFCATSYEAQAYAIPNDVTVFAKALVECLSGLAGVDDADVFGADYEDTWWVTASSLYQALNYKLALLAEEYRLPRQQVNPTGMLSNIPIVRLREKPVFRVKLYMMPNEARQVASIEVCDDYGAQVQLPEQPFRMQPIVTDLPGGIYRVEATDKSPPLQANRKKSRVAKSPTTDWWIVFDLTVR